MKMIAGHVNEAFEPVINMELFAEIAPKIKVLARSTPHSKLLLVDGLKKMGKIVAVTADGTNDVPALAKADVGFAMSSGSEVCKGAASMIVTDDSFNSVAKACLNRE